VRVREWYQGMGEGEGEMSDEDEDFLFIGCREPCAVIAGPQGERWDGNGGRLVMGVEMVVVGREVEW
jgi:hypothetical protein